MLLTDLIAKLEELAQDHPDAEVRLMNQSNWPFEYSICGVASSSDIAEEETEAARERAMGREMGDEDEDGPLKDPEAKPEVIYLVEGSQLGYGNKAAWNVCDR
ncbi:MAG: hypothetical protein Q8O14_14620 [bacterium]|nr:hypothetical protein [bacterium]